MKTTRRLLILAVAVWTLLPWLFWCIYQLHKPEHADVFWLLATPFVYVSFIPMTLLGDSLNWFSLGAVVSCSAFNLIIGTLLALALPD